MKILFLFPYPHSTAPSQRFRFEQYLGFLAEKNILYDLQAFLDLKTWHILYQKGHYFQKIWGIIKGFFRRFLTLFRLYKYDFVFIHREATPVGPPIFEWLIVKVFRKKIIFDFDDAIWLPNTSAQNSIAAAIKFHNKTAAICRRAYKISAGNEYLCDYVRQFNPKVVLNPTTIDTENLHILPVSPKEKTEVCIGWTGTHSTIKYLDEIVPIIQELEKKYTFRFLLISDKKPDFELKSLVYKPWTKESEIADLFEMDIGLMPLKDDLWARGKCGFKALQYMALQIPALASPVGVNTQIIDHEINGFLCQNPADWQKYISLLMDNPSLRKEMGIQARKKVIDNYSVLSNKEIFLNLFS